MFFFFFFSLTHYAQYNKCPPPRWPLHTYTLLSFSRVYRYVYTCVDVSLHSLEKTDSLSLWINQAMQTSIIASTIISLRYLLATEIPKIIWKSWLPRTSLESTGLEEANSWYINFFFKAKINLFSQMSLSSSSWGHCKNVQLVTVSLHDVVSMIRCDLFTKCLRFLYVCCYLWIGTKKCKKTKQKT